MSRITWVISLLILIPLVISCEESSEVNIGYVNPEPHTISSNDIVLSKGLIKAAKSCEIENIIILMEQSAEPIINLSMSANSSGAWEHDYRESGPLSEVLNTIGEIYEGLKPLSNSARGYLARLESIERCEEAAMLLIEKGESFSRMNLYQAAGSLSVKVVNALLERGVDPNELQRNGNGEIAERGFLPILAVARDFPRSKDEIGEYGLDYYSAGNRVFEVLYDKLDMDFLNEYGVYGDSPPLMALFQSFNDGFHLANLQMWLNDGANPCVERGGRNSIQIAIEYEQFEAVELMGGSC